MSGDCRFRHDVLNIAQDYWNTGCKLPVASSKTDGHRVRRSLIAWHSVAHTSFGNLSEFAIRPNTNGPFDTKANTQRYVQHSTYCTELLWLVRNRRLTHDIDMALRLSNADIGHFAPSGTALFYNVSRKKVSPVKILQQQL